MKRNLIKPLIYSLVSASILVGCNSGMNPNPKLNNSNINVQNGVNDSITPPLIISVTEKEVKYFFTPKGSISGDWSIQDADDPAHANLISGSVTNINTKISNQFILTDGINLSDPKLKLIKNKVVLINLKKRIGYDPNMSTISLTKTIKTFVNGDKALPSSTINSGEQLDFIDTQLGREVNFLLDADTHQPRIISYKSDDNVPPQIMVYPINTNNISTLRVGNHGMQAQFDKDGDNTWYSISENGIDTHNGITLDPTNLNFGFENEDLFDGYRGHRHIDAVVNGAKVLVGNEDGSTTLTHNVIPLPFMASDSKDDGTYRQGAYLNQDKLPNDKLIPHRTYNQGISLECTNDSDDPVPCDDLLSNLKFELSSNATTSKVPLSEISKPLQDALINKKIVSNDGSINFFSMPKVTDIDEANKIISFSYTPYYAQDLGSIHLIGTSEGKTEIDMEISVPKVDAVYNYKFETELSNSRIIDVDYNSDETKPSFNISDEFAGSTYFNIPNEPANINDDVLKKEGRYGFQSNYTHDGTDWSGAAPHWDIFYLNHPTKFPIPVKFVVEDGSYGDYGRLHKQYCNNSYVTSLQNGSGGHYNYSLTLSSDGTPTTETANYVICTDNSDGTGTRHWNHAYSHYDRDYNGAGPSIRVFRN